MTEKCQDLSKLAKGSEKENRIDAIELYKQAAECFEKDGNSKEKNTNLKNAAKLLTEIAKLSDNPITAFENYEKSSSLQKDLGNEKEAAKIMEIGYQNYLDVAEKIWTETRKISDIELVEQRLSLASRYALLGKDEKLSNRFWVDLGDLIREKGKNTKNPHEAYEIFKRAILNYRKGDAKTKEYVTLTYASDKYSQKAAELHTKMKNLATAIDYYLHAEVIYQNISVEDKAKRCRNITLAICEIIGMPLIAMTDYIKNKEQALTPLQKSESTLEKPSNIHQQLASEIGSTQTPIRPSEEPVSINPMKAEIEEKLDKKNKATSVPLASPELIGHEKPSIQFLEDPNYELNSNEELKTRIKEEIRRGPQIPPKDDKQEIQKSKEISKLFDDVLSEIKEDSLRAYESPSSSITQVAHHDDVASGKQNEDLKKESFEEPPIKSQIPSEMEDNKSLVKKEIHSIHQNDVKPLAKASSKLTKDIEHTRLPISPSDITKELANGYPELEELTTDKRLDKAIVSGPIIDILVKQGYINKQNPSYQDLLRVPEYEILSIVIAEHPIEQEQIETKSKIDSIPLVLSNLQADGLVSQTNDYRWTISSKVRDNLHESSSPSIPQKVTRDPTEHQISPVAKGTTTDDQLIKTLRRLAIIPDRDQTLTTLLKNHEFAIIKIVNDEGPVDVEVIKAKVSDVPAVQINRILSRLELDGRISKSIDNLWRFSDNFMLELKKN
ncbi:MAG: hypothetical protein GPJ54_05650 [Candidatus Heimdallarchaeota archaeon]|nr:hypothetical protein [Candidatus Heimdallarchaeota archaeon]